MKVSYIMAVLAILLLIGCAQTTVTPTETAPPTAPAEEPVVEEPAEVTPEVAEVEILVRGFDPEEVTVKKGTTVRWINTAAGTKIVTIEGKSSDRLESGDTYEKTFEEVGEYRVFDLFGKRWGKVIVVEELAAAGTTE